MSLKSKLSVCLLFVVLIFICQCGRTPPPRWPWWTQEDSIATERALLPWRDFLNPFKVLTDTYRLGFTIGLTYQDSSSRTGDTIYKIAHIIRAWVGPTDSIHINIYQFGVTVDTIVMKDTFCQVIYRDSMSACRLHMEYDSLWVVGFRPDTLVDTTKTPPETTVVQKVSYVEKRGFPTVQQATKIYAWATNRWLFLPRERSLDTFFYSLAKISGGYANIPNAEESPQITRVILSRPGQVDTIFYSPRKDGRGLANLRWLDSLYQVRVNEELLLTVIAGTPQDTIADKNRFFLTISGNKNDITQTALRGVGVVRFTTADTGYQHIYIEALPYTNLFYPFAPYTGTLWVIPVKVISE